MSSEAAARPNRTTPPSTRHKARIVNGDDSSYGTFAEIGAGQEVARWFFRAGRASRTIAKTMSAYDMTFSDAIYGAQDGSRYVCENRLHAMLDKEYALLEVRLGEERGESTRFFAFANTVTSRRGDHLVGGHGWMGVRFQHEPGAAPSEAIIHVRMLDRVTLDQQEAVGVVGVNLLYASLFLAKEPVRFVASLSDNLGHHDVEVDFIRLTGPAFGGVDNRLLALHLVEFGLTDAVLFDGSGAVQQPADAFFGKDLLIQRGRFRPVTHLHLDMLESARAQFCEDDGADPDNLLCLMEITLHNLLHAGHLDATDFLERVDVLSELGYHVMVSNYAEYHRLSEFVAKYTKGRVGVVMGVGHLRSIFDEQYYVKLPGGLMAALGQLFRPGVRALVYPAHSLCTTAPCPTDVDGEAKVLLTAQGFTPPEHLKHLYLHLLDRRCIADLRAFHSPYLRINSEDVLADIQRSGDAWADDVPASVAARVRERNLFGYGAEQRKTQ